MILFRELHTQKSDLQLTYTLHFVCKSLGFISFDCASMGGRLITEYSILVSGYNPKGNDVHPPKLLHGNSPSWKTEASCEPACLR